MPAKVNNDGLHDIYWTSSNKDIIKISNNNIIEKDGLLYYYVTVNQISVDTKVILTMSLEVNGKGTYTKEYEVLVFKIDMSNQEKINFTFFADSIKPQELIKIKSASSGFSV